ncbi:MAG: hypothetical protein VCB26_07020, partial [Candidatus Hydrogenedentota bacterium]
MGVRQIVAVVLSVAIIVGAVVWAYMAATTVENGSQHTVKRTPLSESYHFAKNKDISTKTSPFVPPTTSPEAPTNQPESTGKSEDLEQSSWFAQVQEGIRKGEYNVSWQDKSVIEGDPGGLHITNRKNNLRGYFREDGVQIVERESSDPDWDVRWQFESWGRDKNMLDVARVLPTTEDNTNRLSYHYPGIKEWFVNTEAGLEHGFTIAHRPSGVGPLILIGQFAGSARSDNGADPNTIEFRDEDHRTLLQYAKLEVTDATGRTVPASLRLRQGETRFVVHDTDAIYPITVDPIFIPAPIGDFQVYGDQ